MVEMIHNNCPPDEVTLNTIISSLCQKGLHWQAIEFLKLIPKKGRISNSTNNIIVRELLKAGDTQGALDLLCGMGNICPLDVITYNRVIASLSKSCKMDKALDLLNVMVSKGFYPDTTTYQSLAFGL